MGTDNSAPRTNFGTGEAFSLGVEEELLVVGRANQLADDGERVVDEVEPEEGTVTREVFKAMVETNSIVCSDARAVAASLSSLRRELLATGARLIGAGVHPTAMDGESEVHRNGRYGPIGNLLKGILRTPTCGQHIHVGMPDEQAAIRAYNGIRAHVPLINALAANSPFWNGEDSGLASSRMVIFRSYPRVTLGPRFESFEEFRHLTDQICHAGDLEDYTHIWWDVRLHPNLGTVEVRSADAQFDIRRSAALAALVHSLARIEAERDQPTTPPREALAESVFQATRHGLDAVLLSRKGERVPARRLCRETLDLIASHEEPSEELAYIETMLEEGNGADVQRRVHAHSGLSGLLDFLVAETANTVDDDDRRKRCSDASQLPPVG